MGLSSIAFGKGGASLQYKSSPMDIGLLFNIFMYSLNSNHFFNLRHPFL
jgi:hypothetical protein